MIEVSGLRKEYGGFLAVRDNTFTVEAGEIFGIVGPNGAGKTTTLKTVAGLIEPTAGEIAVAGGSPTREATRAKLGFLPEESPVYEDMTARSYLSFFADLYDVQSETARDRIESTLDELELEHRDRRLGDVSKGMKRKVAIARSLVNDPDVLIYDEPASGLDPLTTNYVLEFVRELADRGKTVLFSAHNLYHVESVCDRVLIMDEGEAVARGTMDAIRAEYGETTYHVFTTVPVADPADTADPADDATTVAGDATSVGDDAAGVEGSPTRSAPTADARAENVDAEAATAETAAEGEAAARDETYRIAVDSMAAVDRVREACTEAGGRVTDIRTRESTLEEIFLDVAGQPMPGSRRVGDESFSTDDASEARTASREGGR